MIVRNNIVYECFLHKCVRTKGMVQEIVEQKYIYDENELDTTIKGLHVPVYNLEEKYYNALCKEWKEKDGVYLEYITGFVALNQHDR